MPTLKWTRDHKSECGRFWCYKPPRADEWQLWDRADKDGNGNARRYYFRKFVDAKQAAERLAEKPEGKPLIEIL